MTDIKLPPTDEEMQRAMAVGKFTRWAIPRVADDFETMLDLLQDASVRPGHPNCFNMAPCSGGAWTVRRDALLDLYRPGWRK